METNLFKIEILQSRKYDNQTLHFAKVTNKQTLKSVTDWFKPFNKENIKLLENNINWSVKK